MAGTNGAAGQVTCNLNDLGVSQSVTIVVDATAATVGTQSATVSATSGATDLVTANNSATATTTVSAVVPPAGGGGTSSATGTVSGVSPPAGGGGGGGGLSLYEVLTLLALLAAQRSRMHRT
jgi:hypothetical protein